MPSTTQGFSNFGKHSLVATLHEIESPDFLPIPYKMDTIFAMLGTIINIGTIIIGSLIGMASGARIPKSINRIATSAIGLVTLVVGVELALKTSNVLILLISLVVGGVIGTVIGIEDRLSSLSQRLQERFPRLGAHGSIPQGFVSASLLFCVGPMAILGALRDGLYGDWHLLGLKSVMDGISSIILVAGLGPGVILSVFIVLLYQGGISLVANLFTSSVSANALSQSPVLLELDAVGGVVLIVLSLKLLELSDLRAGNFLPALAVAPLLVILVNLVIG